MKRMYIHLSVEDLTESIRFYSMMFGGIEPTVHNHDYCKWELLDPAVNFAISQRLSRSGIDHFGIQVETEEELTEMRKRFAQAEFAADGDRNAQSSGAVSDKSWTVDPQGVAWETSRRRELPPTCGNLPEDTEEPTPDTSRSAPRQSAVTIAFRRRS